jgi:site-specific recombinase XerD
MTGIRRTLGIATAQKTAVVTAELRKLLTKLLSHTLAGVRDRALLLVGFAGGFRRSELIALDVEDFEETEGRYPWMALWDSLRP